MIVAASGSPIVSCCVMAALGSLALRWSRGRGDLEVLRPAPIPGSLAKPPRRGAQDRLIFDLTSSRRLQTASETTQLGMSSALVISPAFLATNPKITLDPS